MITFFKNSNLARCGRSETGSSLDSLDNWECKSDLLKQARQVFQRHVADTAVHMFIYSFEADLYLDFDKKSIFVIPSSSTFITALLKEYDAGNRCIRFDLIKQDVRYEDMIIMEMLISYYSSTCVVPIVHLSRLLAFFLIEDYASQDGTDTLEKRLAPDDFLLPFISRFRLNLYAAMLYEAGQFETSQLSRYAVVFGQYNSLAKLRSCFLLDIHESIPFDRGVYYKYSPNSQILSPVAWYGLDQRPQTLSASQGVCGMVLATQRILLEENIAVNPSLVAIREESFLRNSIICIPVTHKGQKFGVLALSQDSKQTGSFSVLTMGKLCILSSFLSLELHNRYLLDKVDNEYFKVIISLSHMLEARDEYTAGHSERVMVYAMNIASQLAIPASQYDMLQYAALLHDIGKIGIPDNILLKQSALTDAEYEIMKRHPKVAYSILKDLPYFTEISKIILYHHERLDGNGYYHIKDVPLLSLILSTADIYDALTSERPYRSALKQSEALEIMRKMIGTVFPDTVFQALLRFLETNPKELDFTELSVFCIM